VRRLTRPQPTAERRRQRGFPPECPAKPFRESLARFTYWVGPERPPGASGESRPGFWARAIPRDAPWSGAVLQRSVEPRRGLAARCPANGSRESLVRLREPVGPPFRMPPGLDESQLGFCLQSDFERRVGHYSTGVDRPTILPWAEISTSWPRPRGAREAAPGYSRR
jgi:hypothetical protein